MKSQYMEQRFQQKMGYNTQKKPGQKKEQGRGNWFKKMWQKAPRLCMECEKPTIGTMLINPAAVVAHILPKRPDGGCPSVQYEEDNVVFLCGDCHTNMDNLGADYVKKMKIYPLLKQRVTMLWDRIARSEQKNVPDHLRP